MGLYDPPSQEIFDDIKENSIKIWNTYGREGGYRDEKINRIKNTENIKDNVAYLVAMFDMVNQAKLIDMVKPETAKWIRTLLVGEILGF